MRGSPLLRTLVVLAALLVTGLALSRLTAKRGAPIVVQKPETIVTGEASKPRASFELILSGTAKEITLDGGAAAVTQGDTAGPLAGSLELSGDAPLISLRVTWNEESPGYRFAKLRLEVPGKETLEHVFSAPGEIDDIWEPLP